MELSPKRCKTAILLYFSILRVYLTHLCFITFWTLEHLFIEKNVLKLYIFWQHVMHSRVHFSISFSLHSRVYFSISFTLHSRVHFSINFIKNEIVKYMSRVSRDHTFLLWCTAYNLWTFIWIVHFELLFRLKGTEQIYFPSILISVLWWDL